MGKSRGPDVIEALAKPARLSGDNSQAPRSGDRASPPPRQSVHAKASRNDRRAYLQAACVAALVVMLIVIGTDIFTRSLFNFSFEISDELGGYMLVVITFLSLSVCQVNDSFHHVELVQSRCRRLGARSACHL